MKNKTIKDFENDCRFKTKKGYCRLTRSKCTGYDVFDCGEAEDFDDCNPLLDSEEYYDD